MSLVSALHNAMSGLFAASRASGVVSDNIANAMTPGYVRRSLVTVSDDRSGSGVRVLGVARHADPAITAGRRDADARFGAAGAEAEFAAAVRDLIGAPDDPGALPMRVAAFRSSLIEAASRPDSGQRLDRAVRRAAELVAAVNRAAEGIRDLRDRADAEIGRQVERLNTTLARLADLDARIVTARAAGADTASYLDQRRALIDEVNAMVPVRVVTRADGRVALYATGGAVLLDGRPARFGFAPAGTTRPEMTVENGALSGLTIDGRPVATAGSASPVAGGTLAAQFRIRDELAVEAGAGLDAFARDLAERFQAAGLDPSVAPGAPGLFTDEGTRVEAAAETGLALRLRLNPAVDPARGGESWRLRAGLGAADPGRPGEGRLLSALADALAERRSPVSAGLDPARRDAGGRAAELQSRVAGDAGLAEEALAFASATRSEALRRELALGVDTDAEMQTLLEVERAYAANARVIRAVDEMMQTILRM